MSKNAENGGTLMVRTVLAIPIDIGGGQTAKINLPPGAKLAAPVKVRTLPNQQTIANVTVMAPPGVVEAYVAQAAADSEAGGGNKDHLPKTISSPIPVIAPPAQQTSTAAPSTSTSNKPSSAEPPVLKSATPSVPKAPSAPSNLFDKLSKPQMEKPDVITESRAPVRSMSSEDELPLSNLITPRPEPKKKSADSVKSSSKDKSDKKPQTGFGSFLEEKRAGIVARNLNSTEKEIIKEAKQLWGKLDVPSKNHYIRNSDAYKIKKGASSEKSEKKKSRTPSSPKREKNKLSDSKMKDDSSSYNHPKRNVKRKFFDVEEDYDSNDADWVIPDKNRRSSTGAFDSDFMSTSMPPLKFKKKSKQSQDSEPLLDKYRKRRTSATNDDYDLPSIMDLDDKAPSLTKAPEHKSHSVKHEHKNSVKESTPPPPLRKIENVSLPQTEQLRSNLKLICIHDGCYEEAKSEPERGKYWCSDKCCILYCKSIFNAWVGARKANMIE